MSLKRSMYSAIVIAATVLLLSACSSKDKKEGESLTQIIGVISKDGKTPMITTSAGVTYRITKGSIRGLLGDLYNGKNMRIKGIVLEEPGEDEPGEFHVKKMFVNVTVPKK